MGRVATSQRQARAWARRRIIASDHDPAARDERVQAAAAEAIAALAERCDAIAGVQAVPGRAGEARRRIIAEGIKVAGVAQLCDLPVREVQRLRRATQGEQDPRVEVDRARRHLSNARPLPGHDETSMCSCQVEVACPTSHAAVMPSSTDLASHGARRRGRP